MEGGDSGSPLFFVHPRTGVRHVVGIMQQSGSRPLYLIVCASEPSSSDKTVHKPSIPSWLDKEVADDTLSAKPMVPLFSWWDDDRADNFLTSRPGGSNRAAARAASGAGELGDPGWGQREGEYLTHALIPGESHESVHAGRSQNGYTLYRHQGYAFDPAARRPPGTVPLFTWWNADRRTTSPRPIPVGASRAHGSTRGTTG